MSNQQKMTDKQRIEFAKQIELMYEAAHPRWRKLLFFTFLRGIATGLGVFVGGTIVVGMLLWVLSGLGQVPFLNHITNKVEHTLQQGG